MSTLPASRVARCPSPTWATGVSNGLGDAWSASGQCRNGREHPLGVGFVVVLDKTRADRAVRDELEVALELGGVVVAVPDRDALGGERPGDLGRRPPADVEHQC